jgi:hypothetical protein
VAVTLHDYQWENCGRSNPDLHRPAGPPLVCGQCAKEYCEAQLAEARRDIEDVRHEVTYSQSIAEDERWSHFCTMIYAITVYELVKQRTGVDWVAIMESARIANEERDAARAEAAAMLQACINVVDEYAHELGEMVPHNAFTVLSAACWLLQKRGPDAGRAVIERMKRMEAALRAFDAALYFNIDRNRGMVGAWFKSGHDEVELYRLLRAALDKEPA